MLFPAGLLLHSLAFGTLVAPVFSLQFNFTSVQQCAPILFSFSGLTSTVSRAPASLTILPFNSTAIVIPIQNTTFSTGIGINVLPFAAGSQFIASLDDVSGSNIINISDIIPVLPSPNGNSTCVPDSGPVQPRPFVLASPVVSQCQNFTVNYNTTMVSQAPNVRLYSPSGPSFFLHATSDNPISGVATYTMASSYGLGIILLMDDGQGNKETTPLLTVGGDSSSPQACLSVRSTDTPSSEPSSGISSSTSRIIVICSVTVGGVAVLLGICAVIFVLRHHRRRRRAQHIHFDRAGFEGHHNEKGNVRQVIVLDDPFPTGLVTNPVSTSKWLLSPKKASHDRNSLASWSQAIPEDQYHPVSSAEKRSLSPAIRLSADVKGVLNMSILQPETIVDRKSADPVVFESPTVLQPALLRSPLIFRSLSGRHLRAPSDVPADLNSRTCSAYSTISTNPIHPAVTVTQPNSFRAATPSTPGQSINGGFIGLPSSPRDGPRANAWRVPSTKRSNTGVSEAYGGIAR